MQQLIYISLLFLAFIDPVVSVSFNSDIEQEVSAVLLRGQNKLKDTIPIPSVTEELTASDTATFELGQIVFIQFGAFASELKANQYEAQLIDRYTGVYVLKEFDQDLQQYLYKVVMGPMDKYAQLSITRRLQRDSISYWIKDLGRL